MECLACLATVLLGFDLQGWITVIGGFLLGLITLFTGYDHVDLFGRATVRINQQIGLLVLIASLATLVVEAQLAPVVAIEIRSIARKQRMQQLENEISQIESENVRLAELNARIAALWPSSNSNAVPTQPPDNDSPI